MSIDTSSQPTWLCDLVEQSQHRNWREGETCRALFASYHDMMNEVQTTRQDMSLLTQQVHEMRGQLHRRRTAAGLDDVTVQRLAALQLENARLRSETSQWKDQQKVNQALKTQLKEIDKELGAAQHTALTATGDYEALRAAYTEREREVNVIKSHYEQQQAVLGHYEILLADSQAQIEALKQQVLTAQKAATPAPTL